MSGEREVQRYRHYYNTWCGSESEAFSVEDPDGDWVKRDDHVRVVEGLRAELERTKAERNTEHVKTNRALLRVGEGS